MKFSEVIGQQEAKQRLRQLVCEDRVPHAMMLCGPSGCGKMALALAFASYLLGERDEQGASLLTSQSTIANVEAMLRNWQHPDLHFTFPVIRPAGTSSDHKMISDDFGKEWRQQLKETLYFSMDQWIDRMKATTQQALIFEAESDNLTRKLSLKSSQGGYKVCVIWLPERMNQVCANKLLKLLEEPPLQTIFIMVCEEPEKLLETIRSRVQRIDIKRIDNEEIIKALIEKRGIEANTAQHIARTANGSWLRAIETLEANNENKQFLETFIRFMRLAYMRNIRDLKKWVDTAAGYGREKQRRMLAYYSRMIRESFMYNFHQSELNYMTVEEENFTKNFACFINEANVIEIAELLETARKDIGQNANAKIVFFDLALKIIVLLIKK